MKSHASRVCHTKCENLYATYYCPITHQVTLLLIASNVTGLQWMCPNDTSLMIAPSKGIKIYRSHCSFNYERTGQLRFCMTFQTFKAMSINKETCMNASLFSHRVFIIAHFDVFPLAQHLHQCHFMGHSNFPPH